MSYSPTLGRWVQADPKGYVDGLNLQEYVSSNPTNLVDPMGTQGASTQPSTRPTTKPTTQPSTQPTVPTFKGFGDPRYQKYDALIAELVADFNRNKSKYCGCTAKQREGVPDLDPALVKSWMIQETGGNDAGSRAAWDVDPTQVNVPGDDWDPWKEDIGLTRPIERNEGDIRSNLTAALKWLCRKGFGKSGQPARNRETAYFDGWGTALERYGPPKERTFYGPRILDRAKNPKQYLPIGKNE